MRQGDVTRGATCARQRAQQMQRRRPAGQAQPPVGAVWRRRLQRRCGARARGRRPPVVGLALCHRMTRSATGARKGLKVSAAGRRAPAGRRSVPTARTLSLEINRAANSTGAAAGAGTARALPTGESHSQQHGRGCRDGARAPAQPPSPGSRDQRAPGLPPTHSADPRRSQAEPGLPAPKMQWNPCSPRRRVPAGSMCTSDRPPWLLPGSLRDPLLRAGMTARDTRRA